MATKTCPPGSYILDAAGFVSVQAVRNAVAHPNCDGLSLYNGGRYGCTIEQVKIVVDAGKCVGPNWERRANEAMYGSGAWAVDSARAGVEKWGIDPSTVPTILSAVDFGPSGDQYAQLDYWHETACDRADETNTWIGYYGETRYGNHLVQQPWWQRSTVRPRPTWTWGGSGMIADTNMKQHYGFPSGINWSSVGVIVDESRVEAGLEMYAAEGDPPNPQETDMPTILQCSDAYAAFISPSNGTVHCDVSWLTASELQVFATTGLPVQMVTVEQLKHCLLHGPMPVGDKVEWSEANFRAVCGQKGDKGDTPHGTFTVGPVNVNY
jgi:hypothetical protein